MYISYCKKINDWAIGYTHCEYNHAMNPDPFSYNIQRGRRTGYDKAVQLAKGLGGKVSYRKAKVFSKTMTLNWNARNFSIFRGGRLLKS